MTSLRARLVLPDARGRSSGGFLVNERLSAGPNLDVCTVDGAAELEAALHGFRPTETAIVDSLFLFTADEADVLVRLAASRRIALLAHSLPSLIPGVPIAQRLARLRDERALLARAVGAIAPSTFMARALERRGAPADAISLVAPAPICDGRDARPESDAGRRPPAVLTVANWTPAKGLLAAVGAMASAADLSWVWTIVGDRSVDPAHTAAVDRAIDSAGLRPRVSVVGSLPPRDLAVHYARASLFVLPSQMESYGLSFAEAVSFGLPVVGFACAAVPEVVGRGGILTRPGDTVALAAAVHRGLTAPAEARIPDRAAITSGSGLRTWPEVRADFARAAERVALEGART